MSLKIESVNLIRKTNISTEDTEAFLCSALEICTGSAPGDIEWQNAGRMERARTKAVEYTITDIWQPTGMVDVRRVRIESYTLEGDEKILTGARNSYTIRNLPEEGSIEFRIDNTRLKGASMEVYATAEAAAATAARFREAFTESDG